MSFLGQQMVCRHATVFENDLAGIGPAHPELVEFLRGTVSGRFFGDDKRTESVVTVIARFRNRVDDADIGLGRVRNPHLVAVQHVVIAVAHSTRRHSHDVGPRAGFAHGEGADVFTGKQAGKPLFLLRIIRPATQLINA